MKFGKVYTNQRELQHLILFLMILWDDFESFSLIILNRTPFFSVDLVVNDSLIEEIRLKSHSNMILNK